MKLTRLELAFLTIVGFSLIVLTFTASPKPITLCPCPEVHHAQS